MKIISAPLPDNAIDLVTNYLKGLQTSLCASLEAADSQGHFYQDVWQRPNGGGGISADFKQGLVFAKACVNFSHIFGEQLPKAATLAHRELEGFSFHAMGVSVVLHPDNPFVPTAHANVRFFIAEKKGKPSHWWFGGGYDLTPYYGFVEDCKHWHQTAKAACQPFGADIYPRFKKNCDEYFFLKHRNEARGIGGLFFDDYREGGFENSFALTKSIGDHFFKAYGPIVEKRKQLPFGSKEKAFQLYRRGRYVEFNLIYDRGTLFGLQSGGRTESILMSLPPEVHWQYNWQPEKNSAEAELYTDFLPVRDWI